MTRDDIIRMAREAGYMKDCFGFGIWDSQEFNTFAALVAAHEREKCAKVLDEMAAKDKLTNYYKVAANAIRARGQG